MKDTKLSKTIYNSSKYTIKQISKNIIKSPSSESKCDTACMDNFLPSNFLYLLKTFITPYFRCKDILLSMCRYLCSFYRFFSTTRCCLRDFTALMISRSAKVDYRKSFAPANEKVGKNMLAIKELCVQ